MSGRLTSLGMALALVAVAACTPAADGDPARTLTVFASASLTEAFGRMGDAFEAAHPGTRVRLQLAGTPVLVQQLRHGAPAGVFAAADEESMAEAVALGVAVGEPEVFATNALELVVAPGNPERVTGLADLTRDDLVVALAAEEVPAGRYARRALGRAGIRPRPDTLEASVKAIVTKVALGEVDVGVVYRTDVRAAAGRVDGVPIPRVGNVEARLPIVALQGGGEVAQRFVAFVRSTDGRHVLREAGFGTPERPALPALPVPGPAA